MPQPTENPLPWLTTGDVAKLYRRHRDTIWDWINKGIDSPAGRIYLDAERIGGNWMTTRRMLKAFFAKLKAASGHAAEPVAESPAAAEARARRDQEEARRVLGGERRKPRRKTP